MHLAYRIFLSVGFGSVVQLVRIHACHAWGREFESRPDRQQKKPLISKSRAFFMKSIFIAALEEAKLWVNSTPQMKCDIRRTHLNGFEQKKGLVYKNAFYFQIN